MPVSSITMGGILFITIITDYYFLNYSNTNGWHSNFICFNYSILSLILLITNYYGWYSMITDYYSWSVFIALFNQLTGLAVTERGESKPICWTALTINKGFQVLSNNVLTDVSITATNMLM